MYIYIYIYMGVFLFIKATSSVENSENNDDDNFDVKSKGKNVGFLDDDKFLSNSIDNSNSNRFFTSLFDSKNTFALLVVLLIFVVVFLYFCLREVEKRKRRERLNKLADFHWVEKRLLNDWDQNNDDEDGQSSHNHGMF
jgi:cadmium resistance protein CadD (predicted permease)